MEINAKIKLAALPKTVKGMCSPTETGGYVILINERLSEEERTAAFLHEMLHIWHNDFEGSFSVKEIEKARRGELEDLLKVMQSF